MRAIISLVLALFGATIALAQSSRDQSARIDRIEVLGAGIMKPESELKPIENKDISTGTRIEARTKIVRKTDVIPAKVDTHFGVEVKFHGKEKDARTKVRVVWTYPEPGIKNPATGVAKTEDAYDEVRKIGETSQYFWSLNDDYTLVPGKWTLELWQGDRRLIREIFTLVK